MNEKETETISTPANKWLGFQNVCVTHTSPAHPQHQISDLHAPPPPNPPPMFYIPEFGASGVQCEQQGAHDSRKVFMIQNLTV